MELYVLDDLLRRERVVDEFESLIWVERFSQVGDFELVISSTPANRVILDRDKLVSIDRSHRIGRILSVENVYDTERRAFLRVKGRHLESILDDRVVAGAMDEADPWEIVDTPGNVMRYMFDEICRNSRLSGADSIPFLTEGSLYPPGNVPEPSGMIVWLQDRDTLSNALIKLAEFYGLGFRLFQYYDASLLCFEIYSGNDRTTSQTDFPAVVFSPRLDNLQNTTDFQSSVETKNVAYVFAPAGYRIVYADGPFVPGVDEEPEGFNRRILLVTADTAAGTTNWETILDQLGATELAKHRDIHLFDGEVAPSSEYRYGVDYELGDLVETVSGTGSSSVMRIIEQIFVTDREGEREYPTFSPLES